MLAYHPVTGKEVRVIQTDFALHKEHRTLYFGEPESKMPWDTVWIEGGGQYCILLETVTLDKLKSISCRCLLTLVSRGALGSLTPDDFRRASVKNVLVLEEFSVLYPHLGVPWDGTLRDAVCLLAGLLRVRRLAGMYGPRAARLEIEEVKSSPAPLVWITQTYKPAERKRARELQKALALNAKSRYISKIVLLNEEKQEVPTDATVPIEQKLIGKRLSYKDVFQWIAAQPPETLCCFANADIAIDDQTWGSLWDLNMEYTFLALLRYDVPESGLTSEAVLFGPRADSQDTWVVRAGDVAARGDRLWASGALDFQFGRMGCDNAVALDMLRAKFRVSNPAYSLRTWHFHASEIRGYSKTDILERPIFHYVKPTGISDMHPLTQIPGSKSLPAEAISFPLRGPGRKDWVRARNLVLEDGEEAWKEDAVRPVAATSEVWFQGTNLFECAEGVCFTKKELYVGPSQKAQEVWAKTDLYPLSPTLVCKKGIVVPWPQARGPQAGCSREVYMLKYLSKVLRLWTPEAEFFCEERKECIDLLQIFDWKADAKPVLKWEPDTQIFLENGIGVCVSDRKTICKEEVDALRGAVQGWVEKVVQYGGRLRIVIVEDGFLRAEVITEIEEVLERAFDVRVVYSEKTSPERMIETLRGAWGVICGAGIVATAWNWMLPRGAMVFEIGLGAANAEELDAGVFMSAAAGLEHRFCPLKKDEILEAIFEEETNWKLTLAPTASETLPIIYLPRRDLAGYFGHPGDSFRELARLWAKRGYCRVIEHPSATHCWWGDVGKAGVLLYDRPNHDWRLAAPLPEKEWRWALFGNPKPAAGRPGGPWIFWARRPELLEELIGTGLGAKGYAERQEGVVFIGKIENKVQEKRRLEGGVDWSLACSPGVWVMANKTEKHRFSHSEYYERMASARFGLCLAGFGLKCHRETECMALGIVPLCAPEVDMDSYAIPPREGIEYIRVKTPEEAARVAREMSPEKWAEMSAACRAWWKKVCSAEGSFQLTADLISRID